MDDFVERKRATENVIGWITEALGSRVASDWAWSCTPLPCGLPDDRMLVGQVVRGDVRGHERSIGWAPLIERALHMGWVCLPLAPLRQSGVTPPKSEG